MAGPSQGLAADARGLVLTEDVVCFADGRDAGALGLVFRVAGQSDDEALSDSEDDEAPPPGHCRVAWLTDPLPEEEDEMEPVPTDALRVSDRAFMHGDIVARASNTLAQTGVVTSVRMQLRLRVPGVAGGAASEVSVPSALARHVRALHAGDHVLYRQWLGRVEEVVDSLLLRLDDGAVCRVEEATRERVAPRFRSTLFADDEDCPFYPGQRVRVAAPSVLRHHARFLAGGFRGRYDATVLAVEPGQARLRWLAAIAAAETPGGAEEPAEVQKASELNRLGAFDENTWQLGDRALVSRAALRRFAAEAGAEAQPQQQEGPPAEAAAAAAPGNENDAADDDAEEEAEEEEENGEARSDGRRRRSRRKRRGMVARKASAAAAADAAAAAAAAAGDEDTAVAQVVGTTTFADVRWQDGSVSRGVPAVELVPITHLVDTDFWPGEYVIEKSDAPADAAAAVFGAPAPPPPPPPRLGLVRSFDPAARTARVRWLAQRDGRAVLPDLDDAAAVLEGDEAALTDPEAELVSTYDIEPSPEHPARHGDVVLMLDAPPGTARDALPPAWWVGEVLGIRGGRLRIAWADGRVTAVAPEEVYVVTADEEDGGFDDEEGSFDEDDGGGYWDAEEERWVAGDGDGDASSGWATDEAEEGAEEGEEEEEASETDNEEAAETDAQRPPRLLESAEAAPEAAAAAAPEAAGPQPPPQAADAAAGAAEAAAPEPAPARGSWFARLLTGSRGGDDAASDAAPPGPPAAAAADAAATGPLASFARFDCVTGAEDNHFFSGAGAGAGNARSWARAVRREWDCLQAGLPSDIWVRAYEERMDLLRVAIAGAEGTPYARHLLIFDFQFPETYPDEPPLAHYHSHGLRPNPNLYATGKVCLSLLGTWAGKEAAGETWQPGRSTCLQVLLSLQALVLVPKPYFNEAGWAGQAGSDEGERNSVLYNEQVRLVMLRTAVAALRAPPRHLGELLRAHYAAHGDAIVAHAEAEVEGRPPPQPQGTAAGAASESTPQPPSEGYRASLRRLLPAVRAAFAALKEPAASARP